MRLALVGVGGLVANALLEVLSDGDILPTGSRPLLLGDDAELEQSDGLMFKGRPQPLHSLRDFDFRDADIAVFAGTDPAQCAATYERAHNRGCHVIDASGHLSTAAVGRPVVAGVSAIDCESEALLLSSPDPAAVALAQLLNPLREAFPISAVQAVVCRSVSSFGRAGVDELAAQSARLLSGQPVSQQVFPAQIAFNMLAGSEGDPGLQAMRRELPLILDQPTFLMQLSALTVPVFYGLSVAVSLQFAAPVKPEVLSSALRKSPQLHYLSHPSALDPLGFNGDDRIHVGNIYHECPDERAVSLWLVSDNIRKGAAFHIVELLQKLIKNPS